MRRLIEGSAVGRVIRSVAFEMAGEIAEKFRVLRAFLIAADGEEQLGLHDLRSGCMDFQNAITGLQTAISKTTVRGEAGHSDE